MAAFAPGSAPRDQEARPGRQPATPVVVRGGFAVDISHNVAVIGAPGLHHDSGGVYIYRRSGDSWHRTHTLTDPDPHGKHFGIEVSLSGLMLLVGAIGNQTKKWPGAAFIYRRSGRPVASPSDYH